MPTKKPQAVKRSALAPVSASKVNAVAVFYACMKSSEEMIKLLGNLNYDITATREATLTLDRKDGKITVTLCHITTEIRDELAKGIVAKRYVDCFLFWEQSSLTGIKRWKNDAMRAAEFRAEGNERLKRQSQKR